MIDNKKVLEIANYIIKNNATIEMVCDKFLVSRRTAQAYSGKYLEDYANSSNDSDIKELYEKVKIVKNNNQKENQIQKLEISLDEVIENIIKYNYTIEYAALKFGISESTINKYISYLKKLNNDLYKKYTLSIKQKNELGKIVGGKNSKRQPTISEFESLEIAETMISNGMTLEEAEKRFDIPKSTIYERIRSIDNIEIQNELDILFEKNKKRI